MASVGAEGPSSGVGRFIAGVIDGSKNVFHNVSNGNTSTAAAEGANILSDLGLPRAGKGAYFGTMEAHRATLGSIKGAHKRGGLFAGAQVGASAALDYFTGMKMPSVQARAAAGTGMFGEGARGGQMEGIRQGINSVNPFDKGRFARMGARGGALAAGLGAASYLNPFSFGD